MVGTNRYNNKALVPWILGLRMVSEMGKDQVQQIMQQTLSRSLQNLYQLPSPPQRLHQSQLRKLRKLQLPVDFRFDLHLRCPPFR